MNQPTREEFEEFKQEIRQEVRQLREQRTEEIKAVRVEVASEDVINRMKVLEQGQQELKEDTIVLKDDVGVLKIEMQGARADISNIKATQSDHSEFFIQHGQRLSTIETKQDAHTEVLGQIVNISEGHTKRFDQIDASITELRSGITELRSGITEQDQKLDLILKLMQPKGE